MNTIYNEIKDEFGVEATSAYYSNIPVIPLHIAQRIVAKYPSSGEGRWDSKPNPMATLIARRYLTLVMGVK
jgi:hypothetical protein